MLMDMNDVLKMATWCHEYNARENAVQRLAAAMHWVGEGIRFGNLEARDAAIEESRKRYRESFE